MYVLYPARRATTLDPVVDNGEATRSSFRCAVFSEQSGRLLAHTVLTLQAGRSCL